MRGADVLDCREPMSITPRCDLHGPYTAEEAAALVLGTWLPEPTGHLCETCTAAVAASAQSLADAIDARASEFAYQASLKR